jgi:hypothetical protein
MRVTKEEKRMIEEMKGKTLTLDELKAASENKRVQYVMNMGPMNQRIKSEFNKTYDELRTQDVYSIQFWSDNQVYVFAEKNMIERLSCI